MLLPRQQTTSKLVSSLAFLKCWRAGRRWGQDATWHRQDIVPISALELTTANGHLLSVTSDVAAVLAPDCYGTNSIIITSKCLEIVYLPVGGLTLWELNQIQQKIYAIPWNPASHPTITTTMLLLLPPPSLLCRSCMFFFYKFAVFYFMSTHLLWLTTSCLCERANSDKLPQCRYTIWSS